MSVVSNKIKKIAINHFNENLTQSLSLLNQKVQLTTRARLDEDKDKRIPQNSFRRQIKRIKLEPKRSKTKTSIAVNRELDPMDLLSVVMEGGVSYRRIEERKLTNVTNRKEGRKMTKVSNRFVELPRNRSEDADHNDLLDRRIDRIRIKYEMENKEKAQSNFYSPSKPNKMTTPEWRKGHRSLHNKTTDSQSKKENNQIYAPLDRQIKRPENIKADNLGKANPHFIEMGLFVDPETRCNGVKKASSIEKNTADILAMIQKVKTKMYVPIANNNFYFPIFTAPLNKKIPKTVRPVDDEEAKFKRFCNKKQNETLNITQKELYRFKQLIYLNKEETVLADEPETFMLPQESEVKERDQAQVGEYQQPQVQRTKRNMNISNLKSYQMLIRQQNEDTADKSSQFKESNGFAYHKKEFKKVYFQSRDEIRRSGSQRMTDSVEPSTLNKETQSERHSSNNNNRRKEWKKMEFKIL